MKQTTLSSIGIQEGQGKYHEEGIYSLVLIYNLLIDVVSTYLAKFHLTPGKFNILMMTKHQGKDQGISQVEISKRLIVTPSNMTKLIDKLEKEGLVTRTSLKEDRRVNLMKITARGSKLLDEVWPGYAKILEDFMGEVEPAQRKTIAVGLKSWLKALQK